MQTEDKKKEIVSKTVLLLSSEDARADITTRAIAKNAGVNPAMINYYFGSKDSLLKAAVTAMKVQPDICSHSDGARKAMFDYLMGVSETSLLYAAFRIDRDVSSFADDIFEVSAKLLEMKRSYGKTHETGDPASVMRTVCFLMTASADPDAYQRISGKDVRIKGDLRMLVSKELDALLGETF